jgi:hypothetical protein
MADPKNNKGRTEFQQYESSPAETNPYINNSQKLSNKNSRSKGRLATPSEEAYLNAHGSKTESQISQDIRNELYALDPNAKAEAPLGMYDTQNDTEEDKRINQSGEGISHTTQRWTEKLKGIPEYENGDFGRAYKKEVDDFVAKNPAYKNHLKKVGYAMFQIKEIDPFNIMEQVMSNSEGIKVAKEKSNPESHKAVDTLGQVKGQLDGILNNIKDQLPPDVYDSFISNLHSGGITAQNTIPILRMFPYIGKFIKPLAIAVDVGKNAYDTYNTLNSNETLSMSEKASVGVASAVGTGLDILETLDPTGLLNFLPFFKMEKGLLKAITNATGVTKSGESMSKTLTDKMFNIYGEKTPEEEAEDEKDALYITAQNKTTMRNIQRQLNEGKIKLKVGGDPNNPLDYIRLK